MTRYLLAGMVLGGAILLGACGEEQVEEMEIETEELEEVEPEEVHEEPVVEEVTETETETETEEEIEQPVVVPQPVEQEQVTETESPSYGTLTQDTARSVISDFLYNQGDLQTFSFQNGNISIDVTGQGSADEAANWYMQLSDELLFYDGLQSLTVNFAPYGTVSFHINEAETNNFGAYFPYEEIEEQLGITYEW